MAISAISLGNTFTNANGTTVLGGLSSGLDTSSIINSVVAAQTAQVTKLQDQITVNSTQATALSTLNQLLTKLQTDTKALRQPQSPDPTTNVFASNSSQVTSNTAQDASNFLAASVTSSATTGTYIISNVSQLATATTQETNAFSLASAADSVVAASPTAGQFSAGTITFASGASITLTAGESLNDVAAAFNTVTSGTNGTGITASILKTSAGQFKLVLAGNTTGLASGFDLNGTQTNTISVSSPSAATSGQFTAGTYTVNGQSVNITANESLNDIATAFNTAGAGVTASVVQVGTGTYKIIFTGNTADLSTNAAGFDLNTSGAISGDPSGALSNVTFKTDQLAQDALFQFNGVAIDRASNDVSDLVNGVTFSLLQNTATQPGASFTVSVSPDTSKIATAIQSFVTDYNNFLNFYAQQTQVDPVTGVPAKTAVLASDTTLQGIYNQLTGFAASIVAGLPNGSASGLTDIGVNFAVQPATSTTPEIDNILSISSNTLANAITTNLSGIEKVFGYNTTSSSTNLALYSGPVDSSISNFTINVDQTNSVYTAVYTDSFGVQQTVNLTAKVLGTDELSLSAPTTSTLNGLNIIYVGAGDESGITVSTTNGIANQMDKLITSAIASNTGLIAVDQQSITAKTTNTQTQISNINTQVSNTRDTLLAKFSALEAAIASANSALNYLNAQQLASSGH